MCAMYDTNSYVPGSGKTAAFVIPMLAFISNMPPFTDENRHLGPYALILAPTRELAHQIHNECLKLAHGRKWRIILFSKATANTLTSKIVRDKVGKGAEANMDDVGVLIRGRRRGQYAATDGIRTTSGKHRT